MKTSFILILVSLVYGLSLGGLLVQERPYPQIELNIENGGLLSILLTFVYMYLRRSLVGPDVLKTNKSNVELMRLYTVAFFATMSTAGSWLLAFQFFITLNSYPMPLIADDAYRIAFLLGAISSCGLAILVAVWGVEMSRKNIRTICSAVIALVIISATIITSVPKTELLAIRGAVYNGLGQYEKSVDDLTAAIELSPNREELHSQRARAFYALGLSDKERKDRSFEHLLSARNLPGSSFNKRRRGAFNSFEYAMSHLDDACYLEPDQGEKRKIKLEMIATCSRTLEHSPSMLVAYEKRALLYSDVHKFERARQDAENVVALESDRSDSYAIRARVLLSNGDFRSALFDAERAIVLDPSNSYHYSLLGRVHMGLADYENAIANYTIALNHTPNADDLYSRAKAYEATGRTELAQADRVRAIELKELVSYRYL